MTLLLLKFIKLPETSTEIQILQREVAMEKRKNIPRETLKFWDSQSHFLLLLCLIKEKLWGNPSAFLCL